MRRFILLLIGLIPFLVGLLYIFLVDNTSMAVGGVDLSVAIVVLYALFFLLCYYLLGVYSRKFAESLIEGLIYCNLLMFLAFIGSLIQSIAVGGSFDGGLELVTWVWFVAPLHGVGMIFEILGIRILNWTFPLIVITILMFIVYVVGFNSEKIRKHRGLI